MNKQAMLNALGLCMRAGHCVSGALPCEKAIKTGKAKLFLLDKTASESSREQWTKLCDKKCIKIVQADGVGEAIGKPERISVVVTDENFASMILKEFKKCGPNESEGS